MTGKKARNWWSTDCEKCQRWRLIIVWGVIMLLVYLYVWQ